MAILDAQYSHTEIAVPPVGMVLAYGKLEWFAQPSMAAE